MKKHKIFKEPLLLTQLEMAMLLGITRSQWAMYTTGSRGLPARSKLKYETLLQNVAANALVKREKLAQVQKQENEIEKALANLVEENKFEQLKTQKKLTQMKEKFQAALNTMYFVDGLENKSMNKSLFKVLENKAQKVLDKNALALQEVLVIKLEVLKQEEMLLNQRMKKL